MENKFENIPQVLKTCQCWVCWEYETRKGYRTKVLKNPVTGRNASATAPGTWADFEVAVKALESGKFDGVGYVLRATDGLVFIDIDDCINKNGQISAAAQGILEKFGGTYAEKSVSRSGLHIICRGSIDKFVIGGKTGRNTGRAAITGIKKIEVYRDRRFFTFTGEQISDGNVIADCQAGIDWLFNKYLALNKIAERPAGDAASSRIDPVRPDDEVLRLLEKSRSRELFEKLYVQGDVGRYGSHSEADAALMMLLASYCGGGYDEKRDQMIRIFSRSALYRGEAKHAKYLEMTADAALEKWDGVFIDPAKYAAEKTIAELADDLPGTLVNEALLYPLTDAGNAERVKTLFGSDWLYLSNRREWLQWTGSRWQRNDGAGLTEIFIKTARLMKAAAQKTDFETEKIRAAYLNFFTKSENLPAVAKAKSILADLRTVDAILLDADENLLNMPDGTLNLQTGDTHSHERADLITKMTGCTAAADYNGSLWMQTLAQVLPDEGTREYFKRFMGYCLSGDVSEEKFLIAYGEGGRGKGTVLETIAAAMGDYATQLPVGVILKAKTSNGETPEAQLLNLRGARLALCSESGLGRKLDEAKVKWLTGGDTLTARALYARNPTSWKPSHKIVIQSNYLPHISDAMDGGIRRRLVIIPFTASIIEADTTLKKRLQRPENLRPVLGWLLDGYRKWQAGGLTDETEEMKRIKEKFYNDNDLLAQWIADTCETGPGYELPVKEGLRSFNSFAAGGRWAGSVSLKEFSADMEKHGFAKKRKTSGMLFVGVRMKPGEDYDGLFD